MRARGQSLGRAQQSRWWILVRRRVRLLDAATHTDSDDTVTRRGPAGITQLGRLSPVFGQVLCAVIFQVLMHTSAATGALRVRM